MVSPDPLPPGDGRRAQKNEKQVKWRKLDTVLDWIMPEKTTRGWAFSSPLSLAEMKKRLDAHSPEPWAEGDSAWHGDYLGARLTPEARARIYSVENGYVVNLLFSSQEGEVWEQFAAAEQKLLNEVLVDIEAQDVKECEPLD